MRNIAVIFGGVSSEKDISVITGVLTANSLNREKYNVFPVFIDSDGLWYHGEQLADIGFYKNRDYSRLKRVTFVSGENKLYRVRGRKLKPLADIVCAVNCLHGMCGEDGTLSGVLRACKIANASPDMLSSAVSMDKCATKIFLKGLGAPYLPYAVYGGEFERDSDNIDGLPGFPVIVKPSRLGSSIGISVAYNQDELEAAVAFAKKYDSKVLIEKYLEEYIEINSAAVKVDGEITVSECEMPKPTRKILSFEDKYKGGERLFPAPLPQKTAQKIKELTKKIYASLGFRGVVRIDYLLSDGKIYVNEINSVPGSLAYYLFCNTMNEFSVLLDRIIETALADYNESEGAEMNFSSDILKIKGTKGGKRL